MFAKILLTFVALVVATAVAEIPSIIQICGRKNPDLNGCITKSIMSLKEKLAPGAPEIGLTSFDPLHLTKPLVQSLPNFYAYSENIVVYGMSGLEVKEVNMDLEKMVLDIRSYFANPRVEAKYSVNSTIVLPIVATGRVTLQAEDMTMNSHMNLKLVDRKGKKHIFIASMSTKIDLGNYKANFEITEGQNKDLNHVINEVLNDRDGGILDMSMPYVEEQIGAWVLRESNNIFGRFPYDEILPDRE